MSDAEHDLDDRLRAANPVSEDRLPLPSESPRAQLLYEKITGTPYAGGPHRARRRRWVGPGLAGLIALAGAGAAGAYAIASHLTTHLAVTCYAGPTLNSTALAVAAESEGPIATCSRAWAKGSIGAGPVPLLVACLTPQGVAAVFPSAPGADVCGQLGLPPLPAGAGRLNTAPTTTAASSTTAPGSMPPPIRDAVIKQLQGSCLTAPEATLYIKSLLIKANVDWTVTAPSPFPPGRPCASPGFDEANHQVVLTGLPPLPPPSP